MPALCKPKLKGAASHTSAGKWGPGVCIRAAAVRIFQLFMPSGLPRCREASEFVSKLKGQWPLSSCLL